MKKILLDFGGNKGQGLSKMITMLGIDETWKIESFEPNPNLFKFLIEKFSNSNLNIDFHQKAIWDMNGEVNFSIMNENDEGSSVECLITEGRASDPLDSCYRKHDNIIVVKSVDILDVLAKYDPNDFVVIKMDVEGSEFKILRRLLQDKNNCKKIKKIFIEWHTEYLKTEDTKSQDFIINKLEEYGVSTMNHW